MDGKKTMRGAWTPGITVDMMNRTAAIDYKELQTRCAKLTEIFKGAVSINAGRIALNKSFIQNKRTVYLTQAEGRVACKIHGSLCKTSCRIRSKISIKTIKGQSIIFF